MTDQTAGEHGVLDRPGNFRVTALNYYLFQASKTESVAINIEFRVEAEWDQSAGDWHDWSQYGEFRVSGNFWVVKSDGSLNQACIESLVEHLGWDGLIDSVANQTWRPGKCQVVVNPNEYNGQRTFQAAFINAWDRRPGGGNMGEEEVAKFRAKYGAAMRALAANKKPAAAAPAGKPPERKKPAEKPARPAEVPVPASAPNDEVPF